MVGADRRWTVKHTRIGANTPTKITRLGVHTFLCAGEVSPVVSWLRCTKLPDPPKRGLERWVLTKMFPFLAEGVKNLGGGDDRGNWEALYVVDGRAIFYLEPSGSVEPVDDFYAIGSGAKHAYSAYEALTAHPTIHLTAHQMARRILLGATIDLYTGAPFDFIQLKPEILKPGASKKK